MRYSELEKILRENKCYIKRNGGDHDIWFSPATGKSFPVSRAKAKEVASGTLDKIRKLAGLK